MQLYDGIFMIAGAETGNLLETYSNTGAVSINSTIKRSGNYSYCINQQGAFAFGRHDANGVHQLLDIETGYLYARVYFYVETLPYINDPNAVIFGFTNNIDTRKLVAGVGVKPDGTLYDLNTGTEFSKITTGRWYRLDIHSANNNSTFVYGFKLNGVYTGSGGSTQPATLGLFFLGNPNPNVTWGAGFRIFYDDIALSNSGAPNAGKVVLMPAAIEASAPYNLWYPASNKVENVSDIPLNSETYIYNQTDMPGEAQPQGFRFGLTGIADNYKGIVNCAKFMMIVSGSCSMLINTLNGQATTNEINFGTTITPLCGIQQYDLRRRSQYSVQELWNQANLLTTTLVVSSSYTGGACYGMYLILDIGEQDEMIYFTDWCVVTKNTTEKSFSDNLAYSNTALANIRGVEPNRSNILFDNQAKIFSPQHPTDSFRLTDAVAIRRPNSITVTSILNFQCNAHSHLRVLEILNQIRFSSSSRPNIIDIRLDDNLIYQPIALGHNGTIYQDLVDNLDFSQDIHWSPITLFVSTDFDVDLETDNHYEAGEQSSNLLLEEVMSLGREASLSLEQYIKFNDLVRRVIELNLEETMTFDFVVSRYVDNTLQFSVVVTIDVTKEGVSNIRFSPNVSLARDANIQNENNIVFRSTALAFMWGKHVNIEYPWGDTENILRHELYQNFYFHNYVACERNQYNALASVKYQILEYDPSQIMVKYTWSKPITHDEGVVDENHKLRGYLPTALLSKTEYSYTYLYPFAEDIDYPNPQPATINYNEPPKIVHVSGDGNEIPALDYSFEALSESWEE